MKTCLIIYLLIILFSCRSEYKKGEEALSKGALEEAKLHFNSVELNDEDFSKARQRMRDIGVLEKKQVFDGAVEFYKKGRYNEAKLQFYLLSEEDELYAESRKFVLKIDSINQSIETNYLQKKKHWDLEDKNKEKNILKDHTANDIDSEIKSLFDSLILF